MAGQQGQPKYGFGWPDGCLGGLGPPGSTTPVTNKPQRRVYRWSKADWHKIKGLTTMFAESFLALANSRSVNDNYLVFKKFMEGLLKTDIPPKLTG